MTHKVRWLALLSVSAVCALSAAYFVYSDNPSQRPDVVAASPSPSISPATNVVAQTSPVPVTTAATPVNPGPDAGKKYAELVATRKPQALFDAYQLAAGCIWARGDLADDPNQPESQKLPREQRIAQACGPLSSEQIAGRIALAKEAASAGVPMAAVRLAEEGPDGDRQILYDRPNDPIVLQWRKDMAELISLAANKGDYVAMGSLAAMYENGSGVIGVRDNAKALTYQTAMWELHKNDTGRLSNYSANQLAALSQKLSPEDAAAARDAGLKLAATALEGRYNK